MTLPVLREGSSGKAVTYLQERLTAKGFRVQVDGSFGAKTEAAVQQFQASEGLSPDGIVGSITWNRLLVDSTASPPQDLVASARLELEARIPMIATKDAAAVVRAAIRDLGKKESPDGSNDGPEIHHLVGGYNDFWKIGDKIARPWCAMAVSSWIAIGLGMKTNPSWADWKGHPFFDDSKGGGAFRGSSADIESWAKLKGWWNVAADAPIPCGAYFTMARASSGSDPASSPSAGHTGLVICDNKDGTVTTAEGNVSNKVGSHRRKKFELRGWAVWSVE